MKTYVIHFSYFRRPDGVKDVQVQKPVEFSGETREEAQAKWLASVVKERCPKIISMRVKKDAPSKGTRRAIDRRIHRFHPR